MLGHTRRSRACSSGGRKKDGKLNSAAVGTADGKRDATPRNVGFRERRISYTYLLVAPIQGRSIIKAGTRVNDIEGHNAEDRHLLFLGSKAGKLKGPSVQATAFARSKRRTGCIPDGRGAND